MNALTAGYLRLFTLVGIPAFLHWSGAIVNSFDWFGPLSHYSTVAWYVLEFAVLFGLVYIHELGHAAACRHVGGHVDSIVLWPFGGAAYVTPPPQPGPLLWTICGGLVVNLILVPITLGVFFLYHIGTGASGGDLDRFLRTVVIINVFLFLFNLLPIYPMDGGQMLHAALWYALGRARSLLVVSFLGIIGGVALIGVALALGGGWTWTVALAIFVAWQSVVGIMAADALSRPGVEHLAPGHFLMQRGDYQQAIEALTNAMERVQSNKAALATAYVQRGLAYLQIGENEKALADHIEAVRLGPTAVTYFARGESRLVRGEYDRAIADFSQALEFEPNLAAAYSHRGDAYFQLGHYEWALNDRDQARALDRSCPEIYQPRQEVAHHRFDMARAVAVCSRDIIVRPVERRRDAHA
jgi:Zn-dependent protease/Tfp pilus assembly protein PilF